MQTSSKISSPTSKTLRSLIAAGISVSALFMASWLLQSCATSVIEGATLPATEKLVISGILTAGQPVRNIEITRTLPPLDTFLVSKTLVKNAEVTLTVDGRAVPLTLQASTGIIPKTAEGLPIAGYDAEASKYEASGLIVESGKSYTLTVNWNGKRATASTFVPETPMVQTSNNLVWRTDSVTVLPGRPGMGGMPPAGGRPGGMNMMPALTRVQELSTQINLGLQARPNEGYRYTRVGFRDTVRSVTLPDAVITNATLSLPLSGVADFALGYTARFQITPNAPFRLVTSNTVSIVSVEAMDAAFERYQTSANRNTPTTNAFGGSGQNPIWNVTGDGIGVFVGRSKPASFTVRPK